MCGIVGYIGQKRATRVLLECLGQLEYRGYDSAGLALVSTTGVLRITRARGRLERLTPLLDLDDDSQLGIGHTRWATHGRPTEQNAHPHRSQDGKVAVVHNGIIENFMELRDELTAAGYELATETDTECVPMLVAHHIRQGASFKDAFLAAIRRLRGIYAIACVLEDEPHRLMVARSGPPLVIGLGKGEQFIASDATALLSYTRDVIFLEDGDCAELTPFSVTLCDTAGRPLERPAQRIAWDAQAVQLGPCRHYMEKEIFEQPQAIADTLTGRLPDDELSPMALELPYTEQQLRDIQRVVVIACGTSWHAGLVGKFIFEGLARLPTEVDYASEYRYRAPIVAKDTLVVAITQSGETADTLAALKEARLRGARTLAITNVQGSQVTRQADATLLTRAGPEVGVASTKAFTTQLALLLLLGLRFGEARDLLDAAARSELVLGLKELPAHLEGIRRLQPQLQRLAEQHYQATNALYLGRGALYPIALEGALKLKEISYIHAEGYPAGEMKHGPIALIEEGLPVVALMPRDAHRERTLSNLQEAAARDGKIIALVTEGDSSLDRLASAVVELPSVNPWVMPILFTMPLQIFAYHIALLRGCDVDKPRNLAKSVTVE